MRSLPRGAPALPGPVRLAVAPVALATLVALAALPGGLVAQGAGSSASTLLRLAPGPRPLALANAFTAVRDPLSLEYNPAAVTADGFVASYQGLPVDASAGAASLTFHALGADLGVSLRFLNYGQIDVVESPGSVPVGVPTGEVATGGEISALVGGGVQLGPARVGAAGRWLVLDVAGLRDQALVADLGLLLEPLSWLAVGASVQGLGSRLEAGRSAPVLRTARVGAAVTSRVLGLDALVTVEGRRRESRTGLGAGLELRGGTAGFDAALRLGYETRPDPDDAFAPLVVGGGVRLDRLAVELAYRALGPLGSTRQVGLRYRF